MPPEPSSPSVVRGRELFELHCTPCHGPTGEGRYVGPHAKSADLRGAKVDVVIDHVRHGHKQMPAFGPAAISDADLGSLVIYVHDTLAHPPAQPNVPPMSLREASPFLVGLVAWGALVALAATLAALFGPGRN